MNATNDSGYRPLTRGMQIMLLAASFLVFLIGIPLVLLTTQTESYFAWTIGMGLLLFPLSVGRLWPWELTPLAGRAIGAWLTAIGVIATHAVYENDWSPLRSFAASYSLLAVMQGLALLRFGGEIDWSAPAGWFYLLFLLSIGLVGLVGLLPKESALRRRAHRASSTGSERRELVPKEES